MYLEDNNENEQLNLAKRNIVLILTYLASSDIIWMQTYVRGVYYYKLW